MKILPRQLCLLPLLAAIGLAHAGIEINGTRVVYPAGKSEVSVSMVNNDKDARLVQAWVDTGDASVRPETTKAPFVITPPLSRVNPGKGQTLRLIFTKAQVPQDRETVFWLNVLEIPPKPKAAQGEESNYLQFAVRSRLKIFYRPSGLPGSPDEAVKAIHWRLLAKGNGYAVECDNPSAYNVSFSNVNLKGAPRDERVSKGGMCPAKGKETFAVMGGPEGSGGKVVFTSINDYGGFDNHEADFSR
ncbi:fimbria/pilus periplasmic chaperone [Pseudomonas sp. CAN2814]|uniref:fimbrial biogenesis chaperone n=1 Tax=Pseudomonas sp. CAN1 TaxID=3046726 RepID=UPI0026499DAF|nr:fimbria/pilus periplasmic chaperone [Pseudomonas sp. CAN1]MDN6859912.1 fimbria/pilus periplasmic chaperone [Pseudomonas sp. CAN1]